MKAGRASSEAVKRPIYRFEVPPTVMNIEQHSLEDCIAAATKKDGFVVVTKKGQAVALIEPFDQEQHELALDKEFWKMIEERRKQPTISLEELERRLGMKPYKAKANRKKVTKRKPSKATVK